MDQDSRDGQDDWAAWDAELAGRRDAAEWPRPRRRPPRPAWEVAGQLTTAWWVLVLAAACGLLLCLDLAR